MRSTRAGRETHSTRWLRGGMRGCSGVAAGLMGRIQFSPSSGIPMVKVPGGRAAADGRAAEAVAPSAGAGQARADRGAG
jgi:hypothetical protein